MSQNKNDLFDITRIAHLQFINILYLHETLGAIREKSICSDFNQSKNKMKQRTLEDWVKTLVLLYLVLGLLGMGVMFLSNISYIHAFRLQILYFVILCFSNSALLHGLKLKKINCGILWLVFGLMETIMILVYTISHCYVSIVTKDTKTIFIPLIFLVAGVINIVSWFVVYQYVRKLSKETQGTTTVQDATDQNQLQIRYNADGRIDILQDISGLSPGVYSIAPVHKNGRSSSSVMRADGFQNNLLVYPNPESGMSFMIVILQNHGTDILH